MCIIIWKQNRHGSQAIIFVILIMMNHRYVHGQINFVLLRSNKEKLRWILVDQKELAFFFMKVGLNDVHVHVDMIQSLFLGWQNIFCNRTKWVANMWKQLTMSPMDKDYPWTICDSIHSYGGSSRIHPIFRWLNTISNQTNTWFDKYVRDHVRRCEFV